MKYVISIIVITIILLLIPLKITDYEVLVIKPVPQSVVFQTPRNTNSPIPTKVPCPSLLTIPTINLIANIYPVGTDEGGRMDVPKEFGTVGWFKDGYRIGQTGNSVIAGHVDSHLYGEAVFYHLKDLKAGDIVLVDKMKFSVMNVKIYDKDKAPTETIFGNCGYVGLNLITCTGTFNKSKYGGYNKRLVVYCKGE